MSTFSFDISTVTGTPADARITLTELEGEDAGKIQVTVDVINGTIADLRGFFFNIENESPQFLRGLSVSGNDVTDSKFRRNRANNTGGGNNMNGTGTNFDGAIEIGNPGIGQGDDFQSTTFVLSHPDGLTLDMFENQNLGVRLTSVGENRNGSSKLVGNVGDINFPPVAVDDIDYTELNDPVLINVVTNDSDIDGTINSNSATLITNPSNGIVVNNGNGTFGYTSTVVDALEFDDSYSDTFNYTVEDNEGLESNEATVTVNVIDPLRETDQDSSESSNGQLITLDLATEARTFNDSSFAEVDITFGSLTPSDINISFVVDESGSISPSQYQEQLTAVQNTIDTLGTDFAGSGTDIEVQLVGFSDNATQATYDLFDAQDQMILEDITTGTPISVQQGGFTNYEAGLSLAEDFFTTGQGATDENFLVFLTDGQPNRPSGDPIGAYQDELTGLYGYDPNNPPTPTPDPLVDIIAVGFGSGINTATLDPIDNTGAGADVVPTAADLGDILGASPLFPADLLSFSLEVTDTVTNTTTQVADETDLTELPGGDYQLSTTLTGLSNSLGSTKTVVATATFDVDKDGSFDPMIDATRTVTTTINGTDGTDIIF